jgi:CheY-like chemotaxis protein
MMAGNILIVDDDQSIRFTVNEILEDEGYVVEAASDGLDALARLDGFFPALILLDIAMPRMDGYEFADRLRALGLHERIPIVVLTADERARQKTERIGAVAYIRKPFSVEGLLEVVGGALP